MTAGSHVARCGRAASQQEALACLDRTGSVHSSGGIRTLSFGFTAQRQTCTVWRTHGRHGNLCRRRSTSLADRLITKVTLAPLTKCGQPTWRGQPTNPVSDEELLCEHARLSSVHHDRRSTICPLPNVNMGGTVSGVFHPTTNTRRGVLPSNSLLRRTSQFKRSAVPTAARPRLTTVYFD